MAQPLGLAVGNALEVQEAVACLRGGGPDDLRQLCLVLAGEVLEATGLPHCREALEALLDGGEAYRRFELWIEAQGGDVSALDRLELASGREAVRAPRSGVVASIDALAVGRAASMLGAGRERKGDPVDPGVGVLLHAKVSAPVAAGEVLATLVHRDGHGLDDASQTLASAFTIADDASPAPLILERGLGGAWPPARP